MNDKRIGILKWSAAVSAVVVAASVLQVTAFASSLNGDINSGSPTYSGTAVAPDTGTYWNSLAANVPSGPMLLSDGVTSTPITFFVGAFGDADNGTSLTTPAGDLMRDYAFNGSATVNPALNITFSNVPFGRYDLYLYSQNGNSKSSISQFNFGVTSLTAANLAGTTTFVPNNNYVVFQNLTPGGGTIVGSWQNIANNASFNGFQLVAVPEPNTALLLGLGGCLLWHGRRRSCYRD